MREQRLRFEVQQRSGHPLEGPGTTPPTGAATGYRLRVSEEVPASRVQTPLPLDQRAKTVEGVVLTVDPVSVSVRCWLPNRFVELTLPRVFLPEDLAHFGAAVTLEVDQDSPFRRLKIQARQVVETSDKELDEIDEWIDKLAEDQPRNK